MHAPRRNPSVSSSLIAPPCAPSLLPPSWPSAWAQERGAAGSAAAAPSAEAPMTVRVGQWASDNFRCSTASQRAARATSVRGGACEGGLARRSGRSTAEFRAGANFLPCRPVLPLSSLPGLEADAHDSIDRLANLRSETVLLPTLVSQTRAGKASRHTANPAAPRPPGGCHCTPPSLHCPAGGPLQCAGGWQGGLDHCRCVGGRAGGTAASTGCSTAVLTPGPLQPSASPLSASSASTWCARAITQRVRRAAGNGALSRGAYTWRSACRARAAPWPHLSLPPVPGGALYAPGGNAPAGVNGWADLKGKPVAINPGTPLQRRARLAGRAALWAPHVEGALAASREAVRGELAPD